jgi:hypothetical protein
LSAKVAKSAVARLTPICSYNAAIKREQWKACFPIAEREQGRCDSSKGNTSGFSEWDSRSAAVSVSVDDVAGLSVGQFREILTGDVLQLPAHDGAQAAELP